MREYPEQEKDSQEILKLKALLTRVLVVEGNCNINLCEDIRKQLDAKKS